MDLVNHLRYELWGHAISTLSFSGFKASDRCDLKPGLSDPDLFSSVF
jgi:hypothetical protein